MGKKRKAPYDFILRHYRDPGGDDRIERWLPHPEVARSVCAALFSNGVAPRHLEDRLQDVYVRALTSFRKLGAVVPPDLRAMKAFCATVAKNYAIDLIREAEKRKRDLAETCKREDYGPGERDPAELHDRVDVLRQLEVLASLFRQELMPQGGVAILQGIAAGFSFAAIGKQLGISKELVRYRMGEMRRIYRERLEELGIIEAKEPLRVMVCNPSAMPLLKAVA